MKKVFLSMMLAMVSMASMAQETLVKDDVETIESRNQDPLRSNYYRELQRVLIPQKSEFGMLVKPSFQPESSLVYDSVRHELVCITYKSKKNIWYHMYPAFKKQVKIGKRSYKTVPREKIGHYRLPRTKKYRMKISDEFAHTMRTLWDTALKQTQVGSTHKAKMADGTTWIMTDGTTWNYFLGDMKGKTAGFGEGKIHDLIGLSKLIQRYVKAGEVDSLANLKGKIDSLNQELLP